MQFIIDCRLKKQQKMAQKINSENEEFAIQPALNCLDILVIPPNQNSSIGSF